MCAYECSVTDGYACNCMFCLPKRIDLSAFSLIAYHAENELNPKFKSELLYISPIDREGGESKSIIDIVHANGRRLYLGSNSARWTMRSANLPRAVNSSAELQSAFSRHNYSVVVSEHLRNWYAI